MSAIAPPPWLAWQVQRYVPGSYAALLDRLRGGVTEPVTVSSWWRAPQDNAAVGGHPESQHLIGWAVDLVPVARSSARLARALRATGLIAVEYPTHLHVQLVAPGVLGRSGLLAAVGI